MGTLVAILYMLNIIGSITMTIQPIYGLFEKRSKEKDEGEEEQEEANEEQGLPEPVAAGLRNSIDSQTNASTIITNNEEVAAEAAAL